MQATNCPICYELLEVREVGPCMECGSDPREIEEARANWHTYAEYRIFGELALVLCDFCQAVRGRIKTSQQRSNQNQPV